MSTLSYHNKKLINKRKKLRLSINDAAKALTLSSTQIKSLENNLEIGFASPKYKLILLKRYAKLLDIDLKTLIEIKDESNHDEEKNKIITNNLFATTSNKTNYLVLVIIILCFALYLFNSKVPNSEALISIADESEIASLKKNQTDVNNLSENTEIQEQISNNNELDTQLDAHHNEESKDQSLASHDEQLTESNTNIINPPEDIVFISDEEFLCTVASAELKSFSTRNPEKSSYYFYIISHDSQKICVVDSLGALKEYDFKKGAKLSHHGSPPFKIQLNPNISEIYFEGWKVNLQDNDYFIQLNPTLAP